MAHITTLLPQMTIEQIGVLMQSLSSKAAVKLMELITPEQRAIAHASLERKSRFDLIDQEPINLVEEVREVFTESTFSQPDAAGKGTSSSGDVGAPAHGDAGDSRSKLGRFAPKNARLLEIMLNGTAKPRTVEWLTVMIEKLYKEKVRLVFLRFRHITLPALTLF